MNCLQWNLLCNRQTTIFEHDLEDPQFAHKPGIIGVALNDSCSSVKVNQFEVIACGTKLTQPPINATYK